MKIFDLVDDFVSGEGIVWNGGITCDDDLGGEGFFERIFEVLRLAKGDLFMLNVFEEGVDLSIDDLFRLLSKKVDGGSGKYGD